MSYKNTNSPEAKASAKRRQQTYTKLHRDKINARRRSKYKYKDRKEYSKEYCKKNPDRKKNTWLKSKYGITLIDYNAMLTKQQGLCEICRKQEITVRRGKLVSLAADHCHKTNKVRGLLCMKCNAALGNLNDDILLFEAAIRYLVRHNTTSL